MRVLARVLGALLLLALLAVGGLAWYGYRLTRPAGGPKIELEVKPGDSLAALAARLQARGVVRSAEALRLVMRQRGTAGTLREGYYTVSGAMTVFEVADALAGTPRPRIVTVTIPEGKRLRDLPAIFQKAHLASPEGLKAALADVKLAPQAQHSLEGFLFPATYPFRPEATGQEIVRAMAQRMQQEFTPTRLDALKSLHLTVYGWVTLASMVQAEAGDDSQMPVIAGIFLNRLADGMPLGCDPTVAYGLGKDLNQLDRSAGDFKRDTPYNTYTRVGLPRGPINNPGEAALAAVLQPQRRAPDGGRALYFVHGTDGVLHVNSTYAAHLRAVDRYR